MKFYQNKTTKEIIGVKNMRQVIKHPTKQSKMLGYKGFSYEVVYDMIHPNVLLGNGITSFCITYSYLKENYKRINRKIALDKYPEFRQYSYEDLVKESKDKGIDTLTILQNQEF